MLYTVSADALQRFRLMIDTPAHEGVERVEVWSGYHIQESVAIFGPMPGIEPKSVASNLTPEFRQRLAELVSSKLATPTDSVRQLATLQFFFFNLVSDQHWDGIVIWANYIAELKVSGRDRAADAPLLKIRRGMRRLPSTAPSSDVWASQRKWPLTHDSRDHSPGCCTTPPPTRLRPASSELPAETPAPHRLGSGGWPPSRRQPGNLPNEQHGRASPRPHVDRSRARASSIRRARTFPPWSRKWRSRA